MLLEAQPFRCDPVSYSQIVDPRRVEAGRVNSVSHFCEWKFDARVNDEISPPKEQ
jgi:hypothetical protein